MNEAMRRGFADELCKLALSDTTKRRLKMVAGIGAGVAAAGILGKALGKRLPPGPATGRVVAEDAAQVFSYKDMLKGVKTGEDVRAAAFADELTKLNGLGGTAVGGVVGRGLGDMLVAVSPRNKHEKNFKDSVSAKYIQMATTLLGMGAGALLTNKLSADKAAVSTGKAVEAIFHRVYKGKQIIPTINRMAKGYLETAERMGSPVTREGAKAWIKQVQKTKSL